MDFLMYRARLENTPLARNVEYKESLPNGDVTMNLASRVSLLPGWPHENEILCMSCTQTYHDYEAGHISGSIRARRKRSDIEYFGI